MGPTRHDTAAATAGPAGRATAAPDDDIFRFILREDPQGGAVTLALAVVAGLAMSQFITMIGVMTHDAKTDGIDQGDVVRFVVSLAVVVGAQYAAMARAIATAERCLFSVLGRLAARLRATSLETLEREGTEAIHATVSQDGSTISNGTLLAITVLQNLAVFAGCAVFMLVTAPVVFLCLAGFVAIWSALYPVLQRASRHRQAAALRSEQRFNAGLEEITCGFRELLLDPAKLEDLSARVVEPAAAAARRDRVLASASFVNQLRVQGATWLSALAFLAFVLPGFGVVHEVTAAFLVVAYLWLPTAEAVTMAPNLARAGVAITRLRHLEARLQPEPVRPIRPGGPPLPVARLSLSGVSYTYPARPGADPAFAVGPIDLEIAAGEVVFLTGGNGSGKTTLIKLMIGLYPTRTGARLVDGRHLELAAYRSLFSHIPTDFHLFARLYGIPPDRHADGAALIERLGLAPVVGIVDGRFTTTDLSAGQRKRLGLAVALMERRPILVLDEWAADQDPHYRRLFYEDLLADLRAQGRTVIAASHDDRYFHTADRVVTLEDGRICADGPAQSHEISQ